MMAGLRANPHSRWLVLGIIALLALALLLLQWPPSPLPFPTRFGDLEAQEILRGSEARSIVDEMHGKGVTPKENVIVRYEGARGRAVLYLSAYDAPTIARREMERMAGLIERGHPVFVHFRRLSIRDVPMCLCLGMGQAHYFFSFSRGVYWLAVDPAIAQETIVRFVEALQKS